MGWKLEASHLLRYAAGEGNPTSRDAFIFNINQPMI